MSEITIVVNDIAASPGGGLSVLEDFHSAVLRSEENARWVFLLSESYIEPSQDVDVVLLPQYKKHRSRLYFDWAKGSSVINSYNPSVVVSLQNTIVRNCHGESIIYLHQSIPFQSDKRYSFLKRSEFKYACIQHLLGAIIKHSVKQADKCIVQTKWMKAAVEKACGVTNVMQVYPDVRPPIARAQFNTTNQFFYPTNSAPYKNVELLAEAARKLADDGIAHQITLTTNGDCGDGIRRIGRIPLEEVYAYYATSCLVFPSYIETFGYPLLEARSVGTIILASDCDFAHEALDDYTNAYFFDPFDAEELYVLMKKVACGEIQRKRDSDDHFPASQQCFDEGMNSWDYIVKTIVDSSKHTE